MEIEEIVAREGWKKASVIKMRKLDSFLKESIRMHPLGQGQFPIPQPPLTIVGTTRLAIKTYTFSDGTTIPKGTLLAAPLPPIQSDETIYSNPDLFDGFRFSNLREREGESAKHHCSNTATEYLHFGHGQHAWYHYFKLGLMAFSPGRFFATTEIKLMLAFTILRYDIKTVDGNLPPQKCFGAMILPNMNASILYRKRAI